MLVTFTILLEFREHFKKGHPVSNVIDAKLATLKLKCKEVISNVDLLKWKSYTAHNLTVEVSSD